MAQTLRLEIVTPSETALSEDVDYVGLPAAAGEMGIYPNHVPFVTEVAAGEVAFQQKSKTVFMAIGAGFVQIMPDRISILTDMAINEDHIDEERAEEARKRAEARLSEQLNEEEMAVVQAALANSLAQLKVKRRRQRG
jgi:F-type H+-transporting ATPase subunit epsilon